MDESMIEITPQLEKRTHYLATFANLATLLGLLGTVSGLIHAFGAVAERRQLPVLEGALGQVDPAQHFGARHFVVLGERFAGGGIA